MQVEREGHPDAQGEPVWFSEGQGLCIPIVFTANVDGTGP